jgi:arsenate reductase
MTGVPSPRHRILFVCIGNSCRSPMAESIALQDASDLLDSSSAGLRPLGVVQALTLRTLESNGYPTAGLHSKPILERQWADADLVINMSGYPRERTFAREEWHKVEDWDVQDPYGSDRAVYQQIFEELRTRIESLAARLRKTRQP